MKVFAIEIEIDETTTKNNMLFVSAADEDSAIAWVHDNYSYENFGAEAEAEGADDSLVSAVIDHELTEEEIAELDEIWNAGPDESNTKEDVLALARTLSDSDLKALLEERRAK